MSLIHPHHNCLHPHKVVNRYTGESIIVPCGQCSACLLSKQIKNSTFCQIEATKYKFCYFVTLTYNQQSVPKFSLTAEKVSDDIHHDVYRVAYECLTPRLQKYYDHYLTHIIRDSDIDKADKVLKERIGDYTELPLLAKVDVQLFLKRLRKSLSKKSNEKIRYYCVGEYGPQTFRPHYHLLFFFNSVEISRFLRFYVRRAWTTTIDSSGQSNNKVRSLGFSRTECVNRDASSYVAGYVNSNALIPCFHKARSFRPFALHSRFFGFSTSESSQEEVHEMQPYDFAHQSITVNGKLRDCLPSVSMERRFFPKIYRFAQADFNELYNYYTLYHTASKFLPPSDFTSTEIIDNLFDLSLQPLQASLHGLRFLCGLTVQQIQSIYYTSKHFINNCCAGSISLAPLRYKQIIDYYDYKKLSQLASFYDRMEQFYESSSLAEVADTIDYWYDWTVSCHREKPIRHYSKYTHWTYLQHKQHCDEELSKHTKHKKLNDLNKIFDNSNNTDNGKYYVSIPSQQ